MHRLGLFLRSFGVSREPLLEPGGTYLGLSWVTLPLLGCLGWPLGALWDQFGLQLGDFVPSWKPCDANLGISWVTLSPWGQIWLLLGIWFANQVFCLIFGCHWLSLWVLVKQV